MGSEVTAAALGPQSGGAPRSIRDAAISCGLSLWAIILRIGYGMGEKTPDSRAAQIFPMVNWFRKNKEGKFLWPGYGRKQPRAQMGCSNVATAAEKPLRTPMGINA